MREQSTANSLAKYAKVVNCIDPLSFQPYLEAYTTDPVKMWKALYKMRVYSIKIHPPMYDDEFHGVYSLWRFMIYAPKLLVA